MKLAILCVVQNSTAPQLQWIESVVNILNGSQRGQPSLFIWESICVAGPEIAFMRRKPKAPKRCWLSLPDDIQPGHLPPPAHWVNYGPYTRGPPPGCPPSHSHTLQNTHACRRDVHVYWNLYQQLKFKHFKRIVLFCAHFITTIYCFIVFTSVISDTVTATLV